jgi:hypothetical protein
MKHIVVLLITVFLLLTQAASAFTVNIRVTEENMRNTVILLAVEDVKQLLASATADSVYVNSGIPADVVIDIPTVSIAKLHEVVNDTSVYADRSYKWEGSKTADGYVLRQTAFNQYGATCGLYGLLQEVLGFSFYHPREMVVPDLKALKLEDGFAYQSNPRFDVTGFHIHTQHPLELTEALHDVNYPNGQQVIREYIDWCVRNRQNYFEFNLLEGIKRKHWPAYAEQFVDYGHNRGLLMGIDLSLHMIQQKTFQLYRFPFKSFRTKKNQIRKNVDMLCQASWDAWDVEFSTTEFSKGNKKKKQKLQLFLLNELKRKNVKLMGREHVVKEEKMLSGKVKEDAAFDSLQTALDRQRTMLVHTVMFYTLTDTFAPVYGNYNLLHMQQMLKKNMAERETWYYPESAYWITFDNSVPLFLPSYLSARLSDILFCDTQQVKGHITFSSGWEWGYWLFDWSIANWSWKTVLNETEVQPSATQYAEKAMGNTGYAAYFSKQLQLHDEWVKAKNLIQYLDAQTITDEMPGMFNLPLHPRPDWTYKWLRRKASLTQLDTIQEDIQRLSEFYLRLDSLDRTLSNVNTSGKLVKEFNDGFAINKQRSLHRYSTLNYIIEKRRSKINGSDCTTCDSWMQKAQFVRNAALKIVSGREASYRYPLAEIALRHKSHTAYAYGYLFPAHQLHFWQREEQQAVKNKWSPFYKSIWNVAKIIGLID